MLKMANNLKNTMFSHPTDPIPMTHANLYALEDFHLHTLYYKVCKQIFSPQNG